MANNIDIILKATDKASKTLEDAGKKTQGFGKQLDTTVKSLTGFSVGNLTAVGAVMSIGKSLIDVATETQKYNLSMIDVARQMGTSTEEASRLVQVADDVRLSQETLQQAMKQAVKQGIQPSISSLAGLADKYMALPDKVSKGQFAMEIFGIRAGPEMEKLLEQGGQALLDYSASIDENLIVTKEAALASEEYFEALDSVQDAIAGVKMGLGNELIPLFANAIDGFGNISEVVKESGFSFMGYKTILGIIQMYQDNANISNERMRNSYQNAAGDMATYYQDLYSGASKAEEGSNNLFDGMTKLTSAMIYNKAAAELDADAALQLGIDMGVIDQEAITAGKTLDLLAKALKSGQLTSGEYADAVERLNKNIGNIQDQEATITLNIITNGSLPGNIGKGDWMWSGGGNGAGKTTANGYASGGDFVVPPGYQNDTFPIYAKSGERVSIENANERSSDAGGSQSFAFYAPITFKVANEAKLSDLMREMAQL